MANNPVKKLPASRKADLANFPNFSITGSVRGMRKLYGKHCKLVRCGSYIYNVASQPELYEEATL